LFDNPSAVERKFFTFEHRSDPPKSPLQRGALKEGGTVGIETLALVMGLCLLVYTLGQRFLRQSLEQTKSTLNNQLGKATKSKNR
jgi:hypothetical protein